jgi:hypothetical protein
MTNDLAYRQARTPVLLAIGTLIALPLALPACSSSSNGNPPADGGGQDAGNDGTTGNPEPDAGGDTGSGFQESGADVPTPPTGDAGEPCTQPGGTCAQGLFCNAQGICQVSYCSGKTERALPYAVATDFQTVFTIGPEKDNFALIPSGAECDSTTYPSIPNTGLGDAGADAAGDAAGAAADAAVSANDAAADGSVDAAGPKYPTLGDGGTEILTYPSTPSCYEFLFDPSCLTGLQGLCWAGAEFTNSAATAAAAADGHPSANAVGVCVAPGATVISFSARASVDGTIVKFGSSRPGACTTVVPIKEADGGPPDPTTEQSTCPNATEFYIALTTGWQTYTITLPTGEAYDDELGAGGGVWNAFSLVVEPQYFVGGAYVFVKDVVWGNPTVGYDAGVPEAGGSPEDGGADEASVSDAPTGG